MSRFERIEENQLSNAAQVFHHSPVKGTTKILLQNNTKGNHFKGHSFNSSAIQLSAAIHLITFFRSANFHKSKRNIVILKDHIKQNRKLG